MGLFNLGSLVLGLLAWILPLVNLVRHKKNDHKNWVVLSIMSISACAISLCLQIINYNYLVKNEDWAALMDTADAVSFVSSILLIVTIVLNVIVLLVYRDRVGK